MPLFRRHHYETPKTPFHVHALGLIVGILWTAAIFYFCFGILQPMGVDAINAIVK